MKRFEIKGTDVIAYLATGKDLLKYKDLDHTNVYTRAGICMINVYPADLLKAVNIGVSFDWAKPQDWVNEQYQKNPNFRPAEYVWIYVGSGDFVGKPWKYGSVLWDYLWCYLMQCVVTDDAEITKMVGEFETFVVPPYILKNYF